MYNKPSNTTNNTLLCLTVYCTLIFLVFHTTVWKTQELL